MAGNSNTTIRRLWIIKALLPYFIGNSRLVFSLAMDRTMPAKFANVNRYGSPTWATHLQALLAIAGVVAFTQSVTTILAITMRQVFMLLLHIAGRYHHAIAGCNEIHSSKIHYSVECCGNTSHVNSKAVLTPTVRLLNLH